MRTHLYIYVSILYEMIAKQPVQAAATAPVAPLTRTYMYIYIDTYISIDIKKM